MSDEERAYIIGQIAAMLANATDNELRVILTAARAYIKKNL